MLGNTVELIRYVVTYDEETENCISEEHKDEVEERLTEQGVEFTTEEIDQTSNEWFDGLEFNSYDEALEVFNTGDDAYNEGLTEQETDAAQLRADVDYIAIMTGVDL
jgi:hypothetical protein